MNSKKSERDEIVNLSKRFVEFVKGKYTNNEITKQEYETLVHDKIDFINACSKDNSLC